MGKLEEATDLLDFCRSAETDRATAYSIAIEKQREARNAYNRDPSPKTWAAVEAADRVVAQERIRLDCATDAREQAQRELADAERKAAEQRFADLVTAISPEQAHEDLAPFLAQYRDHFLGVATAERGIQDIVTRHAARARELAELAEQLGREAPARTRLTTRCAIAHVLRVVSEVARTHGIDVGPITLPRPITDPDALAYSIAQLIEVQVSNERHMSAIEQVDGYLMGRDVRAELAKRAAAEEASWSPFNYLAKLTHDMATRIRREKLLGNDAAQVLIDDARNERLLPAVSR